MGQPHRVWEGTTQDMQSPGVHLRGSSPLLLGVGLVRQAPEGQLKPTRPLPSLLLPPWACVGDSTLGIECASGDTRARWASGGDTRARWASGGLTRQQWGRCANPPQSKQLRAEGPKAASEPRSPDLPRGPARASRRQRPRDDRSPAGCVHTHCLSTQLRDLVLSSWGTGAIESNRTE